MNLYKVIFYLFFLSTLFTQNVFAEDSLIVKWETSHTKKSDRLYEIRLKGTIKSGWHLYEKNEADQLAGFMLSSNDGVVLTDKSNIKSSFQNFKDPVFDNTAKSAAFNQIEITQVIDIGEKNISSFKLLLSYEVADETSFLQEEEKITVTLDASATKKSFVRVLIPSIDINHPLSDCGISDAAETNTKSKGLLSLFLLGFFGGLLAIFTPCVFPMIPLTVSFFTKKAANRKAGVSNAFLYGFFIFLIYILLSLPFHFLDSVNPEILNNISTNVYLNIFFFITFIFFAFSFFGFYEITLPASLSSGSDSKAGVGNVMGIFFMALTLALVSFSCTGPILGSLLAGSLSSDGGAIQLTAGMAGFGLALALPFALFALFPNWLNSLPKSGGWLNSVKIVLGFLELALAFKFLSNADLVKHWGILKREIFIGIWIVIGFALTLYLAGKIKFSHDTVNAKIGIARKILALLFLSFTIYLIPGLSNTSWANLKLISGFPPPLYYSVYNKQSECVLGLNCTRDYEEGLKLAKAENKPLLIDFTGYACVNCRRMEENVWSDPQVFKLMQENFIVVSLYVDDKKILPAEKRTTYITKEKSEKDIEKVGDLWSTFETENFSSNAQPLYALLTTDELLLNKPVGYTPEAKEYLKWLECGLQTFRNKK